MDFYEIFKNIEFEQTFCFLGDDSKSIVKEIDGLMDCKQTFCFLGGNSMSIVNKLDLFLEL